MGSLHDIFHPVRVSVSAEHLKDMALEEELKVLDFVLWLNCYDFALLDCFPLFLKFITSLIKFALWNSGKA